jgi:hypothetical protein
MQKVEIVTPKFDIHDIKYVTDNAIFLRAEELCKKGKVKLEYFDDRIYTATVVGSQSYEVTLSTKNLEHGDCSCYMGQNDQFCKHLLAVALTVVNLTKPPTEMSLSEAEAKLQIIAGMRKFTSYNGPSRIWFSYQRKLAIGAGMVEEALPFIETNKENVTYLWKLVLKLSLKLSHTGVDDSDGTVGNCIGAILFRISEMAKANDNIKQYVISHCINDTGFGFEDDLRLLVNE